jgi:hypothetical protein
MERKLSDVMKHPPISKILITGAILAITFCLAAAGPGQISYQGRLVDATGQPVADGTHQLVFGLYPDSTGAAFLWQEAAEVTTANGLFAHRLGSIQPIADTLFAAYPELFLQVTIAGEVAAERVLLTGAPFARVAGELATRDSADRPAVRTFANSHRLSVFDTTGIEAVRLQGTAYGELTLSADTGFAIRLSAGLPGDSSVMLPNNAINSKEMLNEPGVAVYTSSTFKTLVTGSMTDLLVLQMTVPEQGYIVLHGKCYVILSGTTGPNSAIIQIDIQPGGGTDFPYFTQAGLGGYVNTEPNYFPVYVTRTYFVEPGTYEFRMEGRAQNPLPAVVQTWDHILSAVYYPTAYYPVKALIGDPAGFERAIPITSEDPYDQGRQPIKYEVDLRELERSAASE